MNRPPGWSEVRQGHLLVRYKVGKVRGQHVITHLFVGPHPDAKVSEQGITARDLARVKPSELLQAHRDLIRDADGGALFYPNPPPVGSDEHHERVRKLVVWAVANPMFGTPAELVVDVMGVSRATAHRYIAAARERFPDMPPRAKAGRRPKGEQPEAIHSFTVTVKPPQEESE